MYVARYGFRDIKGMIKAGTIVDPAEIRTFHSRLRSGRIVEVTEKNYKELYNYFKGRHGVILPKLKKEVPVVIAKIVE